MAIGSLSSGDIAHICRPPTLSESDQGSRAGGGQADAEFLALRCVVTLPRFAALTFRGERPTLNRAFDRLRASG